MSGAWFDSRRWQDEPVSHLQSSCEGWREIEHPQAESSLGPFWVSLGNLRGPVELARISSSISTALFLNALGRLRAHVETHTQEQTGNLRRGPVDPGDTRLRLTRVSINNGGKHSTVSVELNFGTQTGLGTATGLFSGPAMSFLAAEATLQAIIQTLGEDYVFILEDIAEISIQDGWMTVVVLSTSSGGSDRYVGGVHGRAAPEMVSKAILNALNHKLSKACEEETQRGTPSS